MHQLLLILITFLLAFPASKLSAASLSLGNWAVDGSQTWHTAYPISASATRNGASQLSYPHSGNYFVGSYEIPLAKHKTLSIEGGILGKIKPSVGSDSDWNYTLSNQLLHYGEFTTSGNSRYFDIEMKIPQKTQTDILYGYKYFNSNYKMTDGIYYLYNYVPQSPPDALPDLYSSYTMTYQGPYIGIQHHVKLTPAISSISTLKYSPLLFAQGHGHWNLRDLDFNHTGTAQMLDAAIGLEFALATQSRLLLAYRYQRTSLFRGWEDTDSSIIWDKATSIQKGIYIIGNVTF